MKVLAEYNDSLLLADFRAGKESAFDLVFHRLYSPLCLFARRILDDDYTAEDLVQDVFVKLWQKHLDFDSLSSIRAFLYISVKNACFNYLEKDKVKLKHQDYVLANDLFDEQSVLHGIIEAEVMQSMISAIEILPDQCRKIIKMTFLEGLKPKEIAAQLGIAVSTVNNQKMRGLSILRSKLSHQDFILLMALIFAGAGRR